MTNGELDPSLIAGNLADIGIDDEWLQFINQRQAILSQSMTSDSRVGREVRIKFSEVFGEGDDEHLLELWRAEEVDKATELRQHIIETGVVDGFVWAAQIGLAPEDAYQAAVERHMAAFTDHGRLIVMSFQLDGEGQPSKFVTEINQLVGNTTPSISTCHWWTGNEPGNRHCDAVGDPKQETEFLSWAKGYKSWNEVQTQQF